VRLLFNTCSFDAAAAVSLASGLLGKEGKEGKEGNDALDIAPRVLPCSVSAGSAGSELPPIPVHSQAERAWGCKVRVLML
jgi:hypothetical protein